MPEPFGFVTLTYARDKESVIRVQIRHIVSYEPAYGAGATVRTVTGDSLAVRETVEEIDELIWEDRDIQE